MTDQELINQIKEVAAQYLTDEDHWSEYFMEQIVDILNTYNGGKSK